ncbi:hypothetical protein ACHAW6_006261 [Cyclotella cf. meneghiniana]
MTQASAAVDDSQWSSQMITTLDNLSNAEVQKNDTVERIMPNSSASSSSWQDTLNALPSPKAPQYSGTPKGTVTTMGTKLTSGITAKLADTKSLVTKTRPIDKTQWEVCAPAGASRRNPDYKIINSVYFTPGCANPPNLNTTALLNTAANISLLTTNAPAPQDAITLPVKTIMQPSSDTFTTSGNPTLSLPKLPQSAKQAYCIPGLTNNLLSAANLADAGCEVFFCQTGCEVSYNREIILQGWQDLTTRLWQVPI